MILLRALNRQLFKPYERTCVRTLHTDRYISVREFYKDKNVLITGCTGFVGQGLVEKLLRSCPDIGRIYIPIRATKKGDTDQRYRAFINNTVFDNLRATQTNFDNKLVPLPTSLEEPNLGLCENTLDTLTNEINVIYHVAALTKFNAPLREAIRSNLLISSNLFRFGKECKNLAAYIHVSTLFAFADLDSVDEKVYPTEWDHNQLIELSNMTTSNELKRRTREIVGTQTGTYYFTKRAGEYMVELEGGQVPVGIVRAGIVSPSWKEPAPGWFSGMRSYIPWMALVEQGQARCLLGHDEHKEEIIPVDLCVNSLISTAWYIGTHKTAIKHCEEPLVVHVQCSTVNALTSKRLVAHLNQYLIEEGRPPRVILDTSRVRIGMRSVIPTLLQTIRDVLQGKPPISLMIHTYVMWNKDIYALQVTKNPHPKEYRNLMVVENSLSTSDKQEFSSDIEHVNWEDYFKTWLRTLKEKRMKREKRNK